MEMMKKYGFPALIACVLLIFVAYYAIDSAKKQKTSQHTIATKEENGDSILYSVNGKNYTASTFYEEAKNQFGNLATIIELQKQVASNLKTTNEMEQIATSYVAQARQNANQNSILSELRRFGYQDIKELKDLIIFQLKINELNTNYLNDHRDDLVKKFVEENNSSFVSHILIKVADVKQDETGKFVLTPTTEEKEKLETVLKELESKEFSEVAATYSEDMGSARQQGSLGYVDNSVLNSFVPQFKDAVLQLKDGEVSQVVETQFGYHIIKIDAKDVENLITNHAFVQQFYEKSGISVLTPVLEKAKELNIEIKDSDIQKYVDGLVNGGAN